MTAKSPINRYQYENHDTNKAIQQDHSHRHRLNSHSLRPDHVLHDRQWKQRRHPVIHNFIWRVGISIHRIITQVLTHQLNNTTMNKELVTIEFRYHDRPVSEAPSGYVSKTITIGVFDTFEDAIVNGNKALEVLEARFKLNAAWNTKERFSKNGGCFGSSNRLITNLAYLQTPFEFYAKITTLTYADVDQTITNTLDALERYKEYKKRLTEED